MESIQFNLRYLKNKKHLIMILFSICLNFNTIVKNDKKNSYAHPQVKLYITWNYTNFINVKKVPHGHQ